MLWSVFFFSGVVAYAEYSSCDPLTSGKIEKPDQIMPHLVTEKLSHLTGIPGIFVAAVYGGVLRLFCVLSTDYKGSAYSLSKKKRKKSKQKNRKLFIERRSQKPSFTVPFYLT